MKPVIFFLAVLAAASLACGLPGRTAAPSPMPSITAPPTLPAGTPLSMPLVTQSPPASTLAPTRAAVPILLPTDPPAPSGDASMRLYIYLVAVGDNGASGDKIGCEDSVIPVAVDVPRTQGVLRAALTRLLANKDQYYGQSGLYNALYQSSLAIDSLVVQDGEAVMKLSGTLTSGGVCDDPRIIAQLEATALQFSTVQRVTITVNGQDIHSLLSGQ